MWNKQICRGLSRELLNLDNCRHLSPDRGGGDGAGNSNVWSLLQCLWTPHIQNSGAGWSWAVLLGPLPVFQVISIIIWAHTSGMSKTSYFWEPAHTARAQVTKQSPHSPTVLSPLPQCKEWHLLVIRGATWFYLPALYCDNPLSSIRTWHQELWPVTFNMQIRLNCVRTNVCCVILASTLPSCFPLWMPNLKSWRSWHWKVVPIIQWGNSTALTWATYLEFCALCSLSSADWYILLHCWIQEEWNSKRGGHTGFCTELTLQ